MSFSSLDRAPVCTALIGNTRGALAYLLLATSCSLLAALFFSPKASSAVPPADGCASCHQKETAAVFTLFARSTHGQAGKSCSSCHGGDLSATDRQTAHGAGFVGKPTVPEQLRMCGNCHRAQMVAFRGSRHAAGAQPGQRPDCVQCHGAHGVGVRPADFSLPYYCSGCHGLEYLPALPSQWRDMLAVSDEIRNSIREREDSGRHPSSELISRAKDIRRQIAGVVHATDLQAGIEKSADIVKQGEAVKKAVASSK
jgi:hypothetical protein